MKKIIILTAMAVLFLGCDKDKLKVNYSYIFQLRDGDNNLSLNEYFTNEDNLLLNIDLLQFYISNISFVRPNGDEIEISEIELIKFDENGQAQFNFSAPSGDFNKLKFSLGVPSELNDQDPSAYSSDENHPLNVTQNTYWGMAGKYRFLMIDGFYDTNGDGEQDGSYSIHTGYDEMFRNLEFNLILDLSKRNDYSTVFFIDAAYIFDGEPTTKIDILTENSYHGSTDPTDMNLGIRLTDNFVNAITVK